MKIGNLNKRITITSPASMISDGFGGFVVSNSTVVTDDYTIFPQTTEVEVWGAAQQLSQRETLLYGLQVGTAAFKFTFIFDTVSLTQQNGLVYNGQTFRIIAINDLQEKNNTIEVIANTQTN